MEDNRHFAHFRDTDGTFFNADAVKVIHASKAIVVQFLLLKTHFTRWELLKPTFGE
ncbi:MAG: hypothetical protein ACJASU_001621 [Cognaticolwellia sp.]|jgi:hypothetical protein